VLSLAVLSLSVLSLVVLSLSVLRVVSASYLLLQMSMFYHVYTMWL